MAIIGLVFATSIPGVHSRGRIRHKSLRRQSKITDRMHHVPSHEKFECVVNKEAELVLIRCSRPANVTCFPDVLSLASRRVDSEWPLRHFPITNASSH
jgi:hypothetical protein